MKNITLLYGIPGSGKSYYAKQFKNKRVTIVDCDQIKRVASTRDKILTLIVDNAIQNHHEEVIIDGLFTTNKDVDEIFTAIAHAYVDATFSIIWWERDIQSCLHNDRGRRSVDSRITIENITFEEPSEELINRWNMAKRVTKKHVVRKPNWEVWAMETLGSKELQSSSWCLGGTSRNCYGDEYEASTTPQEASFVEFDDFIEKICPTIGFLQYKKLYNHSVKVKEKRECDYYGGSITYAHYSCDLEKLYFLLVEMNIVKGI